MHHSSRHIPKPHDGRIRGGAVQQEFRYCMDRHGTQHFNFAQCVWIERTVAMAFTPVRTTALETLAVNLLALATQPRDATALRGCSRTRLMPLARDFCEQCLLGAPQEGWVLPRPVIQAWMAARRRARRARR